MGTPHGDVASDCINGLVALGKTADNGVPIIGGSVGDVVEDKGGVREASGGGGGAKVKEF